jgi:hypothetical protein
MAKHVADVAIGVTADIGPLMRETARAEAAMSRFERVTKSIGTRMGSFGAAATAAGQRMTILTAAMAAAAGAALAFAKSSADQAENILNAANAAGLSTQAYQEYAYALGEVADITDEEFNAATVRLSRVLGEAREGSKTAAAALARVGISAEELSNISADETLARVVAALEGMEDPAAAAAVATDLFGKAGARMGGLIAGTAGEVDKLRDAARGLGIIIPDSALQKADEFNLKWDATVKQFEAVRNAAATVLMPVLVDELIPLIQETIIPAIVSVINTLGEWITAFQGLPEPIKEAVGVIAGLFAVGGPLLLALGAASTAFSVFIAASGPIGLTIAAAGLLAAAWITWGDEFKAVIGGAIDWATGKFEAFMRIIDGIVTTLKTWKDAAAEFLSISAEAPQYADPNATNPGGTNLGGGAGSTGGMGDFPGGGVDDLGGNAGLDRLDTGSATAAGIAMADGLVAGLSTRLVDRAPEVQAAVDRMTGVAARVAVEFAPMQPPQVPDATGQTSDVPTPDGAATAGIGMAMADGLVNGLALRLAERMPEVQAAIDTIPQAARAQLGIQSPSTVFAEIGGYLGEGMAVGIRDSAAMVQAAVASVGTAAASTMSGNVQSILQSMSTLFTGSKKIALALAAVNIGIGLSEALKLPFPASLAALAKVGAEGARIMSGIQGASPGGGGGGFSRGGGGGGGSVSSAPQNIANITLVGDVFSRDSVESLFQQINDGLRQGRVINLVRA